LFEGQFCFVLFVCLFACLFVCSKKFCLMASHTGKPGIFARLLACNLACASHTGKPGIFLILGSVEKSRCLLDRARACSFCFAFV
jgi:hypothetical protein